MKSNARKLLLELADQYLIAIEASHSGDKTTIHRFIWQDRPKELDPADTAAVGSWVQRCLKDNGFNSKKVILSLPRDMVVLKRMHLPLEADNQSDIADMVRLQMSRQLTMELQGTAIDFVPIEDNDSDDRQGVMVLAAALPLDRHQWLTDSCKHASLKIERISLRSAGVAAMLMSHAETIDGAVLGISATGTSGDFVVMDKQGLIFARAADLSDSKVDDPVDKRVHRIVVEAKRTWMSYRVGHESASINSIVVLGDDELSRMVSQEIGKNLEMASSSISIEQRIDTPEGTPYQTLTQISPLAGLLTESTLDFANPRKAPDRAARVRQLVLASFFLFILVVGTGFVVINSRLSSLQSQLGLVQSQAREVQNEYREYLRNDARLSNIQQHVDARVDWLAHMDQLFSVAPPPGQILLNNLKASMEPSVSFTPVKIGSRRKYAGGKWSHTTTASFSLSGHVANRSITTQLRQQLLAVKGYSVLSKGPDVDDRFDILITTRLPTPYPGNSSTTPEQNP